MQKFIYIFIALVLCVVLGYTLFSSQNSDTEYVERIAQKRFEKERFFQTSPQSPFKDKSNIKNIAYYPTEAGYKVEARIEKLPKPLPTQVLMSKGETEIYLQYAYLHFELQGKPYKLLAFRRTLFDPILWVGFRDGTTGKGTYGAGRYLDIAYKNGQKNVVLDFNLAYNPYCAYTPDFVCPLPAKENTLPINITAGEKDIHKIISLDFLRKYFLRPHALPSFQFVEREKDFCKKSIITFS